MVVVFKFLFCLEVFGDKSGISGRRLAAKIFDIFF